MLKWPPVTKAFLAWLVIIGGLGCNSTVVEGDPPKVVSAAPVDRTTNASGTDPVQFVAQFRNAGLPPADRTAILAGLGLVTWPDTTPVAADVALTPATVGTVPALDVFSVTPQSELPGGWYAATLSRPPDDLVWTDPLDHVTAPDGTVSVRVHVGSAPALLRMDFCEKGPSSLVAEATFSEAVALTDPSAAAPFFVVANNMACTPTSLPASSSPFTGVVFDCPGALLTDAFVVAVSDGLSSPAGVPVPAVRVTTTPSVLAIDATGCHGYKFDL